MRHLIDQQGAAVPPLPCPTLTWRHKAPTGVPAYTSVHAGGEGTTSARAVAPFPASACQLPTLSAPHGGLRMPLLTLSQNQLYELNDAALEVIKRMLRDGPDAVELKLQALPNLWAAFQAIQLALVGTTDTPGMRDLEPRVLEAIANPKRNV